MSQPSPSDLEAENLGIQLCGSNILINSSFVEFASEGVSIAKHYFNANDVEDVDKYLYRAIENFVGDFDKFTLHFKYACGTKMFHIMNIMFNTWRKKELSNIDNVIIVFEKCILRFVTLPKIDIKALIVIDCPNYEKIHGPNKIHTLSLIGPSRLNHNFPCAIDNIRNDNGFQHLYTRIISCEKFIYIISIQEFSLITNGIILKTFATIKTLNIEITNPGEVFFINSFLCDYKLFTDNPSSQLKKINFHFPRSIKNEENIMRVFKSKLKLNLLETGAAVREFNFELCTR